jgi:hypothetical protein
MANDTPPPAQPAVRDYTLVCVGALLVTAGLLYMYGVGWWALLPLLLGLVGLLASWGGGPPLVLLAVAGVLAFRVSRMSRYPLELLSTANLMGDVPLAAAVLAYVAGQYRLLSLSRSSAYQVEASRKSGRRGGRIRGWFQTDRLAGRSPAVVPSEEVLALLLTVVVAATLAFIVLDWLLPEDALSALPLPPALRQALVLAWVGIVAVVAAAAVLGYLSWTQASPEEALQYLQDQVWSETRGEQRVIQRRAARARLRAQRREEKS